MLYTLWWMSLTYLLVSGQKYKCSRTIGFVLKKKLKSLLVVRSRWNCEYEPNDFIILLCMCDFLSFVPLYYRFCEGFRLIFCIVGMDLSWLPWLNLQYISFLITCLILALIYLNPPSLLHALVMWSSYVFTLSGLILIFINKVGVSNKFSLWVRSSCLI